MTKIIFWKGFARCPKTDKIINVITCQKCEHHGKSQAIFGMPTSIICKYGVGE